MIGDIGMLQMRIDKLAVQMWDLEAAGDYAGAIEKSEQINRVVSWIVDLEHERNMIVLRGMSKAFHGLKRIAVVSAGAVSTLGAALLATQRGNCNVVSPPPDLDCMAPPNYKKIPFEQIVEITDPNLSSGAISPKEFGMNKRKTGKR